MKSLKKHEHVYEVLDLLEEYADIRDELKDALFTFQLLQADIEYAMEETFPLLYQGNVCRVIDD